MVEMLRYEKEDRFDTIIETMQCQRGSAQFDFVGIACSQLLK